MSIRDEARQEAERIEQSNDIALTVIRVARDKAPGRFVTLDFRYGIADALWDAGYRKLAQGTPEPSDAEVNAAAEEIWVQVGRVPKEVARAALLAAQEVRRGPKA